MTRNTASANEALTASSLSLAPPRQLSLRSFLRWEWMLVLLIALVVVVTSRLSPYFLDVQNMARTSSDFMEIGLMMLPMVFVIITGNIDLSVASTLGMTASFVGWLHNLGVELWVAALAGLALGTLGGMLNGFLVARVRLPALVATLGTYAFYRGIAYVLLGDQAARDYPAYFTYLGQGRLFGTPIPFSVALFCVLALIFGLVLHRTTFGRYLYSIGNNQEASLYSGVPVVRVKMIIFTLSGFMSAVAGLVLAARFGSTRPDIGTGLELAVITAAVLGGVDINGGIGTMGGAFLALLLVGLMRFGMGLLTIQGQVQDIAIGLLLVLSILAPTVARRVSGGGLRLTRQSVFVALLLLVVFVLFFIFFFWSRSAVINAV
jgi:rhamnose transport system permease protein